MPETRYITEYNYPLDIPASEKTVAKAEANGWIIQIPYEVSDKELEAELEEMAKKEVLQELTARKIEEIKAR